MHSIDRMLQSNFTKAELKNKAAAACVSCVNHMTRFQGVSTRNLQFPFNFSIKC